MPSWCFTHFLLKQTSEVPRTHVDPRSESFHTEIVGRMLSDPLLRVADRLALGDPRGQLNAELRLAAGTPHEHHKLPCHRECNLGSSILLEQGQRQIHACGDSG